LLISCLPFPYHILLLFCWRYLLLHSSFKFPSFDTFILSIHFHLLLIRYLRSNTFCLLHSYSSTFICSFITFVILLPFVCYYPISCSHCTSFIFIHSSFAVMRYICLVFTFGRYSFISFISIHFGNSHSFLRLPHVVLLFVAFVRTFHIPHSGIGDTVACHFVTFIRYSVVIHSSGYIHSRCCSSLITLLLLLLHSFYTTDFVFILTIDGISTHPPFIHLYTTGYTHYIRAWVRALRAFCSLMFIPCCSFVVVTFIDTLFSFIVDIRCRWCRWLHWPFNLFIMTHSSFIRYSFGILVWFIVTLLIVDCWKFVDDLDWPLHSFDTFGDTIHWCWYCIHSSFKFLLHLIHSFYIHLHWLDTFSFIHSFDIPCSFCIHSICCYVGKFRCIRFDFIYTFYTHFSFTTISLRCLIRTLFSGWNFAGG